METVVLQGYLMDREGHPVPNVYYELTPRDDPGNMVYRYAGRLGGHTTSSGAYSCEAPPGAYQLQFVIIPRPPAVEVTLVAGQTQTLNIVAETTRHLPGFGIVDLCNEDTLSGPLLGVRLGPFALGMTGGEVWSLMGAPWQQIVFPNERRLDWHYLENTSITFSTATNSVQPSHVKEIRTTIADHGLTGEGLRIGDTHAQFGQIYQGFPICIPKAALDMFQITDTQGSQLHVLFDHNKVTMLRLAATL